MERERPLEVSIQLIYDRAARLIEIAQTAVPEMQPTLTRDYRIGFDNGENVDIYASFDPDGKTVRTVYVSFEPNFTERWFLGGYRGLTVQPSLEIDRDYQSEKLSASVVFWPKETGIDRFITATRGLLRHHPLEPDHIRLVCQTPIDWLADKVHADTQVGREIPLRSIPYPDNFLHRINDTIAKPPTSFTRLR